MSDTVIRVENLGKRYLLKHQQQGRSRYVALRDVIADGVKAIGQRLRLFWFLGGNDGMHKIFAVSSA